MKNNQPTPMNWTTPKIVALIVATSVATSLCNNFLMRRTASTGWIQPGQAVVDQPGMGQQQGATGWQPPDPQAMAEFEGKVKERQGTKETTGEITINLKPYVNSPLDAPLAGQGGDKDNTLAELPTGLHTYGGVPFDVAGLIQLNGPSVQNGAKLWPVEVKDIAIGHPFKKLHLLHGAFNIDAPGQHTTFAKLVLHYADGSQQELEIIGGTHALRCVGPSIPPMLRLLSAPQTELGWVGSNPHLRKDDPGESLHIYRTTIDNPKPDAQVTTMDYISTMQNEGPFMAGLTIE
jgi:hypothetical protein